MAELNIPARPTRKTRAKGRKPPVEAKLLAAAESLLREGGNFASLSVEQLAREAGIARGTFYLHFKDKGDLVGRLMDCFVDELSAELGTWAENAQAAERQDVMDAVKAMLKTFKKHEVIIIAVRETKPNDKNVEAIYNRMMEKIAGMAVRSTSEVKRRGLSRSDTNTKEAELLGKLILLYCTYLIDTENASTLPGSAEALGHICVNTIFGDEDR